MLLLLLSACLLPPSDKDSPDDAWNPFDDSGEDSGDEAGDSGDDWEDSGAGAGGGGGGRDDDGDGYTASQDCDDRDPAVHPDASETCNGLDDDCDGVVDERVTHTFYADADGDGFGDAGAFVDTCEPPAGYVANGNDCDDAEYRAYPGNAETCDGVDNDCNGSVDDGC